MIISHKHKFIFLRTEKTAGTSLSNALGKMIAETDYHEQLARPAWAKFSPIHHGALKRNLPQFFGLHSHATAAQVRATLGKEKFNQYHKVCVERNPWDRQVSLYFHRRAKRNCRRPANFDHDIRSVLYRSTEYVRLNNWAIYAIGNDIVADQIIRYEALESGIDDFLRTVGLPQSLDIPNLRSGFRKDDGDYQRHYSEASRELIGRWYRREIEALGYTF